MHTKRSGTNERIDMYPGMIWRYEAPGAIKQVHIGDEGLVFVQPGETDHVLYIGTCKKTGGNTGGNTDGKAGSPSVVVNGGNTGDNTGDNTCDKVGGETNVIVASDDGEIANILIAAWPSYLREDEGRVRIRILRDGRYTPYWVPTWMPQPRIIGRATARD